MSNLLKKGVLVKLLNLRISVPKLETSISLIPMLSTSIFRKTIVSSGLETEVVTIVWKVKKT